MVSYELANKLKDAGFPMPEEPKTGHYNTWVLKNTHGKAFSSSGSTEIILFPGYCYDRDFIYIPTLSELIEACGDVEIGLFKYKRNSDGAWVYGADNDPMDKRDGEYVINTTGSTPEEAVANLWLALQEEKK